MERLLVDEQGCAPQWRVFGAAGNLQQAFDVAVIMPTLLREEIVSAIESVYAQSSALRIQLLIGVDQPLAAGGAVWSLLEQCPSHVTPCLFYPGYSTSVRHGGLHAACDGGVLRTVLTYLANAELIAYLDDDNWWAEEHLLRLIQAVANKAWAFTRRYFVHPRSKKIICPDDWESVGPGRGVYRRRFGGFVDANCLIINKLKCSELAPLWNQPLAGDHKAMSADRSVFEYLRNHSAPGETGQYTVFYVIDDQDAVHQLRMAVFGARYQGEEARQ